MTSAAGISEVIKAPVDGWFKLLTQDEGEFYNVPVPPEGTDIMELKERARVSHAGGAAPGEALIVSSRVQREELDMAARAPK